MAAFQIDFTATVGHAGFVVQWMLNYLLLLAVGLALETMVSVLTQAFLPFFLIFEYQYVPSLPVLGIQKPDPIASKIIMFNTAPGHALGVHFGALCGVIGVNIVGLSLGVWFERWRDGYMARRERRKERASSEKGEGEDGEQNE
ncbi:hypothetical protein QFC21_006249 [Naganishia friedmannii]|uniref:Uncharacterized protein n=1 Tax=Naganishia friedmannii TaxID=89922 RepID=A0ACC2V4B7_9TREE|nr:hypothetical protein QFC21_006249 [Naganishia friedmannii]